MILTIEIEWCLFDLSFIKIASLYLQTESLDFGFLTKCSCTTQCKFLLLIALKQVKQGRHR